MGSGPAFSVTYWGVTGSFPAPLLPDQVTAKLVRAVEQLVTQDRLSRLIPGPGLRAAIEREIAALPLPLRSTYGGNTTCIEVESADELFVIDCGSGFRELGVALEQRWTAAGYGGRRAAHVLITHPHMDHVVATPFFSPYFDGNNRFIIWGTRTVLDSLQAVLSPESALSRTYFPPTFAMMKAIEAFREIYPGGEVQIGGTRVRTMELCHPGGCLAYRLERDGKACVFATDHEQPEVPDRELAEFARGAELLYTEGQYLQSEYDGKQALPGEKPLPRRGWGHSPVEACVRTAVAAGVRRLHVGHRDPLRGDDDLARLEAFCRELLLSELREAGRDAGCCEVSIPHEGLTVRF